MYTEAYVAQMSLPTQDDLSHVAGRFNDIGRGLNAIDITRSLRDRIEWEIIALNEKRYSRNRVRHVLQALLGSDAGGELRRYDFRRLVNANKRDEVTARVAAQSGPAYQLEDLCENGKYDLAGYAATKLTAPIWADRTVNVMAELGLIAEADSRALQYMPPAKGLSQNGLAMLTRLAVTESRRGHSDTVLRLVRMVLDAPDVNSIISVPSSSAWEHVKRNSGTNGPAGEHEAFNGCPFLSLRSTGFPASADRLLPTWQQPWPGWGATPHLLSSLTGSLS